MMRGHAREGGGAWRHCQLPMSASLPSPPDCPSAPNDPWGRPYQYLSPGIKGEIDVMSFGADGQSGGEGKDADIGSWQ